jgi:hypothetical protein
MVVLILGYALVKVTPLTEVALVDTPLFLTVSYIDIALHCYLSLENQIKMPEKPMIRSMDRFHILWSKIVQRTAK